MRHRTPWRRLTISLCLAFVIAVLSACHATPPDRNADVARLAGLLGEMPGVLTVGHTVTNRPAQGVVRFVVDVQTEAGITENQLAAVVSRYLQDLTMVNYTGYHTELIAHHGWNAFAVDGGRLPIGNGQQIVAQARNWVAMRREFPTAAVRLRATVTHPHGESPMQEWGHSDVGSIRLADNTDYRDVAATVTALTEKFAGLAHLTWTISAGDDHPAEIKSTRRFPTAAELDIWNQMNADQTIPHTNKLTVNGRVQTPVWLAEQTRSHDPADAVALAQRHLPLVATLAAPTLYTASDQIQGHITGDGRAVGPIAITVGGCTTRDYLVYQPPAAEQALMNAYETCRRP
ncbi:hypothetical protein [Mycolicibacterium neworleansense]|uniref:Lipoprotein n=1 Tax=Mycolicibacterium neworleansense TaxID=146018 RepID=A0A0H5RV80_9MYCO|nr:hypothetical protein [Mycolicibacterium neworleansense]MCV7362460.1 hypothetical protein [Mycolicibacterium neworleansense]CRZ18050.1 hypothetical protein BN2156_04951 [Mycolicibacterium neworleansense]